MSQPRLDGRACPVCGKLMEQRFRPFCSRRCADIDLGHWLKGDYAIPTSLAAEDEKESVPQAKRDEHEN